VKHHASQHKDGWYATELLKQLKSLSDEDKFELYMLARKKRMANTASRETEEIAKSLMQMSPEHMDELIGKWRTAPPNPELIPLLKEFLARQ
jgi:hypothetical protein